MKISLVHQSRKNRRGIRERFSLLLLLSLLIHATLILLLALFVAYRTPTPTPTPKPLPSAEPPPPEVTFELQPPPRSKPFVESKESTGKPTEKAQFESNEDTLAASERPPDGSQPLPSQEGVNQPALELQNQRHTPGETPASSATGNPAPQAPPSLTSLPQQRISPDQKPTPYPKQIPTPAPTPQSSSMPRPTPATLPPVNHIKLIEPPPQQSIQTSPASPRMPPSSASGSAGARKGYQPETRQTAIHGNISNRGKSSVAADATPIGRYKKAVADAIGSRWYYYVNEQMGLLSVVGSVTISFKVNASGKVTDLRVVSSSNESLKYCSIRSINDARFPPIPPEVVRTLQNGSLDIDFSFTIY